jgi:hypothetical protein
MKHIKFYLALGAPFAFGEAYFHKIKSREKPSRSHSNLNTADDNTALRASFPLLTYVVHVGI